MKQACVWATLQSGADWNDIECDSLYGTPFSKADGTFKFATVPAGTIRLAIELLDTTRWVEVDLVVAPGATTEIDVRLP